jgi:hypothetical protein
MRLHAAARPLYKRRWRRLERDRAKPLRDGFDVGNSAKGKVKDGFWHSQCISLDLTSLPAAAIVQDLI